MIEMKNKVSHLEGNLRQETYLREKAEKRYGEAVEEMVRWKEKAMRYEGAEIGMNKAAADELRRVWTLLRSLVGDKTLLEAPDRIEGDFRRPVALDPFFPRQDRY